MEAWQGRSVLFRPLCPWPGPSWGLGGGTLEIDWSLQDLGVLRVSSTPEHVPGGGGGGA